MQVIVSEPHNIVPQYIGTETKSMVVHIVRHSMFSDILLKT